MSKIIFASGIPLNDLSQETIEAQKMLGVVLQNKFIRACLNRNLFGNI